MNNASLFADSNESITRLLVIALSSLTSCIWYNISSSCASHLDWSWTAIPKSLNVLSSSMFARNSVNFICPSSTEPPAETIKGLVASVISARSPRPIPNAAAELLK